ncbi:hypothetical protein K474DRAFT_1604503 [Panus rudis PR-1116 ss-1]|nr:hypothetical protein K474DRAFT_1604503 [Panus rudis PR-1116 ss-1]
MVFSENALVGEDQLREAADLDVIAYNGVRVRFGELFRKQRTIVIFIRHFWCAMCQDYMYSIRKNVEPNALKRAGVSLVIIGNGSPGMVKSYRNIFRMPFDLYTDPTLRLHAALGMTLRSNDPGPDSERGSYVKHGLVGGIAMVVRNALRVGMPIWGKGGDATQLGGEFVFDPGMTCLFAHRMKNTRSHAPITDVLHAAGVRSSHYYTRRGINTARSMHHIEDEDQWMRERDRDLARMRNKKEMRRAGSRNANYCGPDADCDQVLYDTDASDSLGSWRLESVDDDMLQMEHDRDPDRGIESEPELMRSPAPPSKKRNVRSAAKTHPYVSNLDPDSPYAYANEKREVYRSENGRVKPKASSPPSRYTNGNGRQVQNDHTYAYTFGKA